MANKKIRGITIEVGGDTTKLEQALKKSEDAGRKASSELREINAALKNNADSAVLWKQKQELLSVALKESRDKVKLLEDAQAQIEQQFKNGEIDDGQYRAFQRELEGARANTQQLEGQLDQANARVKELGDNAENAGGDVKDLGDSAEEAGDKAEKSSNAGFKALAAGITAISAATVEAIKTAEEMEQSYDIIAKKTGAAGESLESLKENTNNVFTSIPTDLDKAATAVGEVNTRFHLTGTELEDISKKFIRFSEINNSDLNRSIGTTSKIMRQWNVDIKDIDGLLGLLTKKSQDTGISVDTLMNSVQQNGSVFKEMGLSLDESINLLAKFEANGVNADTALTGLKKSVKEAVDSEKTLEEALSETIAKIRDAKDGTEALSAAQELFGSRGAAEMATAIREGRINLTGLSEDMSKYKDVVSETYEATLSPAERMKTVGNETKVAIGKLGRELTNVLLPFAEKLLPKIENGTEWITNNLPKIISYGKQLTPVIKGVGTAFAGLMLVEGVAKVKALNTALAASGGLLKVISGAIAANPFGAIAVGAGAAVAAAGLLSNKLSDNKTDVQKLTEEQERYRKKIDETRESTRKMIEESDNQAAAVDMEFDRVERLWKELDRLADSNGNVSETDRQHAQYILGELNSALGTEYEMIGNQIRGYSELSDSIQGVIDKKRAERLLATYQQNEASLMSEQSSALSQIQEQQLLIDAKENELAELRRQSDEMIRSGNTDSVELSLVSSSIAARNTELEQLNATMDTLKESYYLATEALDKNARAEAAVMEGRYKDAVRIMTAELDANKKVLSDTKASTEEQSKAYSEALSKMQTSLDMAIESRQKGYERDAENQVYSVSRAAEETIELMFKSGKKNGEIYTKEFTALVKKMADNGFDISGLTKWAKSSGVKVGDVFGQDYAKVVQQQLNEGFDILDLLRWGAMSGEDISAMFTDEFIKKFQTSLDGGFDVAGLLKWAENAGKEGGITAGELFGENFSNYLARYTAQNLVVVPQINSASDARLYAQGKYDISANAKKINFAAANGGFFSSGRGIIAEAGPELVEIMNGGIKVTPLSENAKNTPVSTVPQQTNIRNIYNTVNAKIVDKYDVMQLAEDLADAEKKVDRGKGN